MELIAGALNGQYLESVMNSHLDDCNEVIALVAYCNETRLFEACEQAGKKVTFIGRLDETVPVSSKALSWFLRDASLNKICWLHRAGSSSGLHAKVIWFKGEGAYIGSANLTARAWFSNIEAGVFLSESELDAEGLRDELEYMIEHAKTQSIKLDNKLFDAIKEMERLRLNPLPDHEQFLKLFKQYPEAQSPVSVVNKQHRKEQISQKFIKEWRETQSLLGRISKQLEKYRPNWVKEDVPASVHLDQFLHGYYYHKIREGSSQPFDRHYLANKNDPDSALREILEWWKSTAVRDFEGEQTFMDVWAPATRELLEKERLLKLSQDEFASLCSRIHAMRDHAIKMVNVSIGLPAGSSSAEEKIMAFGRSLYNRRSVEGKTPLETLYFVLYGGDQNDTSARIWQASHHAKWKISDLGISSFGEIVGWANLPDQYPRNGRTSKALRALGNDVVVY